jgi:hypothetical protein
MQRTNESTSGSARLLKLARRVDSFALRRLLVRYCHEVMHFSEDITMEAAPFELTLRDPKGFSVAVTPFRELFLVSIGDRRALDIRVTSVDGFISALELALNSFLVAQSRTGSAA